MGLVLKLIGGSVGPYILGAVGVVLLGLVLTVGVQHMEIGGLRKQVTAEQTAAHQWHANYDTVFGSLQTLQDAVDQLTAVSNARTKAAQTAVDKAQDGVSKARVTQGHVEAYKPSAGTPEAVAALDILKGKGD